MNSGILTEKDMLLLDDIKKYKLQVEKDCKQLLKSTKQECAQIKNATETECERLKDELRSEQIAKLEQLSNELKVENYDLITKIIHNLEEQIYPMCYKILNKLHYADINPRQVVSLIKSELIGYMKPQQIKITANAAAIDNVKGQLDNHMINYIVKESIEENQCIIEDGISKIYIDINKCAKEIEEIFKQFGVETIINQDIEQNIEQDTE